MMGRRLFSPRFDRLERRLPPASITISGGTPQPPSEVASIDPTEPGYSPPSEPGNPIIIAPVPNPNPLSPTPIIA